MYDYHQFNSRQAGFMKLGRLYVTNKYYYSAISLKTTSWALNDAKKTL